MLGGPRAAANEARPHDYTSTGPTGDQEFHLLVAQVCNYHDLARGPYRVGMSMRIYAMCFIKINKLLMFIRWIVVDFGSEMERNRSHEEQRMRKLYILVLL